MRLSRPAQSRSKLGIATALGAILGVFFQALPADALTPIQRDSTLATLAACPVKTNEAKPGPALRPPIDLAPTTQSAQKLVNFGTSRGVRIVRHITVIAAKPLPSSVTPEQISFEANLSRTGNTLETAEFPDPTFSLPTISADRQSISFSICLNPSGISAGKYVGLATVSGPVGLGAASINLTVNAKDAQLFTFGWIAALFGAFCLLLIKDAAAAKTNNNNWGAALVIPLTNLAWWGATVVALATAFGVLYTTYSSDPAWGATGFAGVIALVGAAFGAIGGHAILTAFGTKS
jgi:hypothetical protein